MVIVLQVKLFVISPVPCPSLVQVGVLVLIELEVMGVLHLKSETARLHRKKPDMVTSCGAHHLETGELYLESTMADGFLEASPTNGGDDVQLENGGSSDEEYERMTAAEVLEKLEEVSGWVGGASSVIVCIQRIGMDK